MAKKINTHGGAGRGQGLKPLPTNLKRVKFVINVTALPKTVKDMGGKERFRQELARKLKDFISTLEN